MFAQTALLLDCLATGRARVPHNDKNKLLADEDT